MFDAWWTAICRPNEKTNVYTLTGFKLGGLWIGIGWPNEETDIYALIDLTLDGLWTGSGTGDHAISTLLLFDLTSAKSSIFSLAQLDQRLQSSSTQPRAGQYYTCNSCSLILRNFFRKVVAKLKPPDHFVKKDIGLSGSTIYFAKLFNK
jgi:hypothetical protein